jgi:hypothetical protein
MQRRLLLTFLCFCSSFWAFAQFLRYIPLPDTESVEAQTFHPVKLSESPKGTAETKEGQEQSALHEDWRMLYKFKVPAPY